MLKGDGSLTNQVNKEPNVKQLDSPQPPSVAPSSLVNQGLPVAMSTLATTSRETELRQLLAEERQRSEQRKSNYSALKEEHIKLQKDFLALQSDTKVILEETKALKERKESELEAIKKIIEDKERLIESLRKELDARDPDVLRQSISQQLREPIERLEREKDSLSRERDRLLGDLKCAKIKIESIEKEMIDSVERVRLSYEAEINLIRKEKEELKVKLLESSKTPEGQRIANLVEENDNLKQRLRSKEKALEDSSRQYAKIQASIEILISEQEKTMTEHERQIETLRGQLAACREDNIKLDEIIKHLRREKDNLVREIKRFERDESRHQEKLTLMEKTCDQEKEKLRRLFVKEKTDLEIERNALLDEIKRFKIDLEVKNETIGRLEKSLENKEKEYSIQLENIRLQEANEKSTLERERASLEFRIAELMEERSRIKQELESSKRQLDSSNEVRLNLEKETMILKAKVETFQAQQEEMDKLRRNYSSLIEELNKIRSELADCHAVNKDLTFQRERFKEEYNRIKVELDEERKELTDYKIESEKTVARLRTCLEEERSEMKMKFDHLTDEYRRKHKEREEMKAKCKQYASLVDKLQNKVKSLEEKVTLMEKNGDEMVPMKVYKELRKQYKELRRRQNELPSSLANCNIDQSPHHVPTPSISPHHLCNKSKTRDKSSDRHGLS